MLNIQSFVLVVVLVFVIGVHAQTKAPDSSRTKASSRRTVLLVDTDDACRLSVDGEDQGVITPAESKKVNIDRGQHIVKCVIEEAPDLVWRKVVEASGDEQVAAVVALKALHIQYKEALSKVHQQQLQAATAEQQRKAAEEQQHTDEAELPQKLFALVKGTWHFDYYDSDPNWRSEGLVMGPVPTTYRQILEFQTLQGRDIGALLTLDRNSGGKGGTFRHRVLALTFHIPPPDAMTHVHCVEDSWLQGKKRGGDCQLAGGDSDIDLKFRLIGGQLQLNRRFGGIFSPLGVEQLFTK